MPALFHKPTNVLGLVFGLVITATFSSPLIAVDCNQQTTWRPSLSEGAEGIPLASCNLWEPGDEYPTIDIESGEEINDLCGSGDLGDTCGPFNNPGWEHCVYTAIPSYSITLNSQAEVDNFQTNYGGGGTCDTVTRTLRISGADITDLSPLSALINVDALNISDNPNLTHIDGLSAITSVGYLAVDFNATLTNLDGLSGLSGTGRSFHIRFNPVLTDITGVSGISSVGFHLSLWGSPNLENINALSAITSVPATLRIRDIGVTNLDAFSAITNVGQYLYIEENNALTNLDGLSGLISVGSDVGITLNPALENCSGLNALLDDVDDSAPGPGPGTAGIPDVGGDVTLSGNLTGCNSVDEVNGILFSDGFEEYQINYTTWRPSLSEGAEGAPLASCNLWEPGDEYPTIDIESGEEINDLCGSGDLGDTCGPFNNPGWEHCVYTAIP